MSRSGLLILLVALALPAPALAQTTKVAPPGNSGVDEYLETVPTAGGGKSSSGPGGTHRLPAAVRSALAAQGADGRAALRAAEQTAPSAGAKPQPKLPSSSVREPSGSSIPSAIAKALEGADQGGMGIWLPILLIVTALAAVGVAVVRRRSSA